MCSAWTGLLNNRNITELPHYAINPSDSKDTFFTEPAVAKQCWEIFKRVVRANKINLQHHHYLEPSAGKGCFYELLPERRRTGLDIVSRSESIEEVNFLEWYPKDKKKYAVIGNPPFGVRGAYALAFINRAFLFADVVAFILPMSFYSNGKGTNMKRVANASLLHSEKLIEDSFYYPETGEKFSVNTVFQVWQKGAGKNVIPDYDVSEYVDMFTVCSSPARLCGLKKSDYMIVMLHQLFLVIK